jgi:hypothetical protein
LVDDHIRHMIVGRQEAHLIKQAAVKRRPPASDGLRQALATTTLRGLSRDAGQRAAGEEEAEMPPVRKDMETIPEPSNYELRIADYQSRPSSPPIRNPKSTNRNLRCRASARRSCAA